MVTQYLVVKFIHVLVAIVALGASAGLGILLEFYADDLKHGRFVLHAIERMVAYVVLPGYALMLFTGLWMMRLSWSLTTGWIETAIALWCVGIVIFGLALAILRKQMALFDSDGVSAASYRRTALLGRVVGAAGGLVVVALLYLMVFKPGD